MDSVFIQSNNGSLMPLKPDYILSYLQTICQKINIVVPDINKLLSNVYPKLKKINTISDIDNQIVATASEMVIDHYIYQKIGMYILIRNLHKSTDSDYAKVVQELLSNTDSRGKHKP